MIKVYGFKGSGQGIMEVENFISIEDNDVEIIKHYVKAVMPVCDGVIAII